MACRWSARCRCSRCSPSILPVQVLKFRRNRRHKQFGVQLPEALELITRSLKAGHPVPVAISMVAREMPDPIGTEFGVVADEVTYGSDLVSALHNLYQRVGHEDLPLFVTAVSIQTSSGGNLREILDGLSLTIRDRGKLKRKVRAISTEGRMSAYILTAVPCLLAAAIMVMMPHFYTSVWDKPMTWYLLGGSVVWLVLGNADDVQNVEFQVLIWNSLSSSSPRFVRHRSAPVALIMLLGGLCAVGWPILAARGSHSDLKRRLKVQPKKAEAQEQPAPSRQCRAREGRQVGARVLRQERSGKRRPPAHAADPGRLS